MQDQNNSQESNRIGVGIFMKNQRIYQIRQLNPLI